MIPSLVADSSNAVPCGQLPVTFRQTPARVYREDVDAPGAGLHRVLPQRPQQQPPAVIDQVQLPGRVAARQSRGDRLPASRRRLVRSDGEPGLRLGWSRSAGLTAPTMRSAPVQTTAPIARPSNCRGTASTVQRLAVGLYSARPVQQRGAGAGFPGQGSAVPLATARYWPVQTAQESPSVKLPPGGALVMRCHFPVPGSNAAPAALRPAAARWPSRRTPAELPVRPRPAAVSSGSRAVIRPARTSGTWRSRRGLGRKRPRRSGQTAGRPRRRTWTRAGRSRVPPRPICWLSPPWASGVTAAVQPASAASGRAASRQTAARSRPARAAAALPERSGRPVARLTFACHLDAAGVGPVPGLRGLLGRSNGPFEKLALRSWPASLTGRRPARLRQKLSGDRGG